MRASRWVGDFQFDRNAMNSTEHRWVMTSQQSAGPQHIFVCYKQPANDVPRAPCTSAKANVKTDTTELSMFGVQRTVPVAEFDGLQQANIWQRPEPPERNDNIR